MDITITDIEKYLEEVKAAINAGCYRIEMNDNRKDNQDLFLDYIISEEKRKQILLSLEATDFSEIRHNTHRGYEHMYLAKMLICCVDFCPEKNRYHCI